MVRRSRRKDAMRHRRQLFFSAMLAAALPAAASIPVCLLSVGTEDATFDIARPASLRPEALQSAPAYSGDDVAALSGPAQFHALVENRRVSAENARAAAIAVQADRDGRDRRETAALHALSATDVGRAALHARERFGAAVTNGLPFVLVHADSEGFVDAPANAVFVRLLFGEPSFSPKPPVLPNTSDTPVKVSLPVTVKAENPAGETLFFETFEQTAVARDPDALVGPGIGGFVDRLAAEAVKTAVSKLPR